MQPVQFQCGHCGKAMAVGSEHLGQQVRCPHCQQIVVAPLPPSAPVPAGSGAEVPPPGLTETILHVPAPPGDGEDIFSQTDVSEDLFGHIEAPRIEMPPDTLAPTLPDANAGPPVPLEPTLPPTLPWVPPPIGTSPPTPSSPLNPFGESTATEIQPGGNIPSWMSGAMTETLSPPPPETPQTPLAPPSEAPVSIPRGRGRTEAKVPWFMLLVFSPLLLYAIFITIFSILLYRQEQDVEQQLRRRFEIMPDEGDKPGVQKGKQISLWKYDSKLPTQPLPEYLCTTLGQPIEIGDLQVTPDRVERKRVAVIVDTFEPALCAGDSLVLYLKMKNLSSEYAFAPLDNYFDRHWAKGARPPFTLLEVGSKHRFHGGPADWYPRGDPSNRREWVQGRRDLPEVLQPGEQKELFVCTDGNDSTAVAVLFGGDKPAYHGSFLWRVRVRRGLVRFKDKDYSATAVIGVRFTDHDIRDDPQAQ